MFLPVHACLAIPGPPPPSPPQFLLATVFIQIKVAALEHLQ